MLSKKKYSHTKQNGEYDCGAACVSTILSNYNIHYNLNVIRDIINTEIYGTTASNIVNGFEKLDFKAEAFHLESSDFFKVVQTLNAPCIAYTIKEGGGHFVVVHGTQKGKIIISDPSNNAIEKIEKNKFLQGFGGIIITVYPEDGATKQGDPLKKGNVKSQILELIFANKLSLFFVLILSVFIIAATIAFSFFIKLIVDVIIPNRWGDGISTIALAFIGFALGRCLLEFIRGRLIIKIGFQVEKSLFNKYFSHLLKLPSTFFQKRNSGELISRFNDARDLRDLVSTSVVSAFVDILLIFISGIFLYLQNENLFFASLVPMFLYLVITYLFYEKLAKQSKNTMENNADVNSYLVQMLKGMEGIKAFNKQSYVQDIKDNKFNNFLSSIVKLNNTINLSNSLKLVLQSTFQVIVLWLGVKEIFSDNMSLGSLLTFNMLLGYFLGATENLMNLQPLIQKGIVAAERLFEILEYPIKDTRKQSTSLDEIKTINIKNLTFAYNNEKIFENATLEIKKGETIAFIGDSGSGKSTLAKLLVNLYEVPEESIFIDGKDINHINKVSLRNKILYVPQSPFFFAGTVLENICLGKEFLEDEIKRASEMSGFYKFLNKTPYGYSHLLTENASNISLGQRQMLMLTRAILHTPDVLILDEATSNIDKNTSKEILENLKKLECTKIIITHERNNMEYFDRICSFSDKEIRLVEERALLV
ncbi:peptidase domain-containing ABC transporter [Bacillus cereus]|nr:peptidase domain-containing ABC transporter [Bacillus cereus]